MRNSFDSNNANSPVTLHDIARQLGTSVSTISRALNERPGVSVALRQRIQDAAHASGYQSNRARRPGSQTVGFAVTADHAATADPFYPRILWSLEARLAGAGYHVLLVRLADQAENRLERVVGEGRVDALVVAGPDIDPTHIRLARSLGVPVVLVDNWLQGSGTDAVLSDNRGGMQEVTEHLVKVHGLTRLAYVGGPLRWPSNLDRWLGFRSALEQSSISPLAAAHESATQIDSGLAAGRRILAARDRPEAVVAVNDAVALGVMLAAQELGLVVPRDLRVVGYDDIPAAEVARPGLTSVHVDLDALGTMAGQWVLQRLQDPGPPPVRTEVAVHLVVRESCGCIPGREVDAQESGQSPGGQKNSQGG